MKDKILYLAENQKLIRTQIEKGQLDSNQAIRLREDVSTDAIFPTTGATASFENFSLYALSGHPDIKKGELQDFQPSTLVVGKGFGKGSSREHAPWALKQSGVETIVCLGGELASIFAENCFALGIKVLEYPDTPETVEEIINLIETDTEEKIHQNQMRSDILLSGGLSQYNLDRLEGLVEPTRIVHNEVQKSHPMTAAEKILSKKMVNVSRNSYGEKVVTPGDTGFAHVDYRMSYELHGPIIKQVLNNVLDNTPLKDPSSIHLFQDHSALVASNKPAFKLLMREQEVFATDSSIRLHKPEQSGLYTEGICHTLTIEQSLVGPGDTAVGTDSHTCTLGVLNTLAWGIGATHMANAMVTKEALIEVPKSVKINISGNLKNGVCAKDVILKLISMDLVTDGTTSGTVFEFDGEGLDTFTLEDQAVLTNMSVEGKAMTGIITRLTPALKGHLSKTKNMYDKEIENIFVTSDDNADYLVEIDVNLDEIEPMVSLPGDPTKGIPLTQVGKTPITNAYIGSCTGGNYNDLRRAAKALKGNKVAPGVNLSIQAASRKIYEQAEKDGLVKTFIESGANIVGLGCGACIGLGPGNNSDNESVTVSATNRNFTGRMGGNAPVFLASPETVANAAINGYLGKDK